MADPSSRQNETLSDWKVVMLCTVIYFLQCGVVRTVPLFYVEIINRYNINRQKASIPFTVSRLVLVLSGPFIGYLANHFQIRSIIIFGSIISTVGLLVCSFAEDIISITLCWGLIVGFGVGTGVALFPEVINRHFDKHLSTANGVYVAGASIGATVLPYVSKVLLDYYGLSGTFLILSGLCLNTVPLSFSLPVYSKTNNTSTSAKNFQKDDHTESLHSKELYHIGGVTFNSSEEHTQTRVEKGKASRSMFMFRKAFYNVNEPPKTARASEIPTKSFLSAFTIFFNPVFLALAIIQSCHMAIIAFMSTMLIDYCLEKGTTLQEGVYVVMVVAVTDLVGRVGLGWITDYGFIRTVTFITGSFILLGFSCLSYIWSNGFSMFVVTSLLYGAMYGVVTSYLPKLFKDYIEPSKRTMAVASRRVFFAPVGIAIPFVVGYFKDTVESYDGLMYVLASISFLGAVLTFFVPHLVKWQQNSLKTEKHNIDQRF